MTRRVYCGVPIDQCIGGSVTLNAHWNPDGARNNKSGKLHSGHQEAFRCFCLHLQANGYTRTGSRTFETPNGTIRVLDKPSKFGTTFRGGKESDKTKNRFVPMRGRGAIVSRP